MTHAGLDTDLDLAIDANQYLTFILGGEEYGDVYKRQIDSCKGVPILMLTTESQQSMKEQAKAAGATGWLVKPFNPEMLLKVIAKVVP